MLDPAGIANWTVTYVDWSEKKWHPKKFMPEDITPELLKNITVSSPNHYDLLKSSLTVSLFTSLEIINLYYFLIHLQSIDSVSRVTSEGTVHTSNPNHFRNFFPFTEMITSLPFLMPANTGRSNMDRLHVEWNQKTLLSLWKEISREYSR